MAAKSELRKDVKITSDLPSALSAGSTAEHVVTLESRWPIDLRVRVSSTGRQRDSLRYPNEPDPNRWDVDQLDLAGASRRFGGGPQPITIRADIHNDPTLPPPPGKINQVRTEVVQLDGDRTLKGGSVHVNVAT